MREGMQGLDEHAAAVSRILQTTRRTIDCEAEFGDELRKAEAGLSLLASPCEDPDEATIAILAPLLDGLARSYTMASERTVHRRFAIAMDGASTDDVQGDPAATDEEDDEDDGLF
jgi:hypothetical protein